jgi:CubicO group peptidase (beta-lactamase class C family)
MTSVVLAASAGIAGPAMAARRVGRPGEALVVETVGTKALAARYAPALSRIAAYASIHHRGYRLPGTTLVCTAPNGYTAFVRVGHADTGTRAALKPDHLFQIGSISKSMVALCIHQLAAEGRLSLGDDIRIHLPDIALPPEPPISLARILEHSSGLPDNSPLFPRTPDGKLWSAFPPGSAWSYSNTGYDLLGKVIERLDGGHLAVSLKRRIFDRLGMDTAQGQIIAADRRQYPTGYAPLDAAVDSHPGGTLAPAAWVNVTFGAGCVAATAADMARWLRYLTAAGQGQGAPLLPDALARAYTAPGIDAPGWASAGARYGAGLAHVSVEGRTLLHHTGGMVSFSSSLHVDPVAGVGCFASTNSGSQDYRPRDLTAYACAVLRSVAQPEPGLAPKPPAVAPAAPPPVRAAQPARAVPPELTALAGRYENDDPWFGAVTIEARPDGLYVEGQAPLELKPEGYWVVRAPASTERLRFTSPMNGRTQVLNLSGTEFVRRDI